MNGLKCMVKRLALKEQLTNIFLCLVYVASLVVLYFDLIVWRPN